MMPAAALERARSRAVLGTCAAIVVVTILPVGIPVGPLVLDAAIVGALLALLLLLPYMRIRGTDALPRGVIGLLGLIFFSCALVSSAANGLYFGQLLTIFRYLAYGLLAYTLAVLATDDRARLAILWTFAVSGAATFALAAYQYLGGVPTAGMSGLDPEVSTRVTGTFQNANFYSEYLVLLFGVAMALYFSSSGRARLFAGAIGLATAAFLFLTYTRGSWLALALALILTLPLISKRLVVAFLGAGLLGLLLVPGALGRATSVFSSDGTTGFRLALWRIAAASIAENPWLGVGPGEFLAGYRSAALARPDLFMGYFGYGAHNSFLTIATEIGLLGAVFFLLYMARLAVRGYGVVLAGHLNGVVRLQALALSTGAMAFLLNSFTSNSFQHPQSAFFFFVVAGLQAGLVSAHASAGVENARDSDDHPGARQSSLPRSARLYNRAHEVWRSSSLGLASERVSMASHRILLDSAAVRVLFRQVSDANLD